MAMWWNIYHMLYFSEWIRNKDVQNKDLVDDKELTIQRSEGAVFQAEATTNSKHTVEKHVLL